MAGSDLTRRSLLGGMAAAALAPAGLFVGGETAQAATLPFSDARVRRALGKAAPDVSFSVRDRVTGGVYTYNPGLRNVTASIVKVLVLATIVRERREDGRSLTSGQRSLAARMIRFSDNDATTSLFRQAGGRSALQGMADDLGMSHTDVGGSWGLTTTTAADQRLLMDRVVGGTKLLTSADRAYMLGLMRQVTPEQRWGVGTVPRGGRAAVKNGWLPYGSRGWRVNSIGAVSGAGRDYTLAILTYDNASMESGIGRTKTVSGLVWKTLAPRTGPHAALASLGDAAPYWMRPGAAMPPHPIV